MSPTILVVGATGNTGRSVVRTLPGLLKSSATLANHRILGLTRSLQNPVAQELGKLPHVEFAEIDWTTVGAAWLREQEVDRVYIAPHNQPNQFAEESAFYLALLQAGVKYVVKVSTNVKYIGPTNPVYYGRTHWAIETLLSQPEFKELKWTSLQPNFFTRMYLASAADWVKRYRLTGNAEEPFRTNVAENEAVAMVDPEDVGSVGSHLLALDDPSPHDGAKYVLSGPEDLTGKKLLALVEKYAGTKVANVDFEDVSWIEDLSKSGGYPDKVLSSIRAGCIPLWKGECSLSETPTDGRIIALAAPRRTPEVAFKALLET
jgi:uncharacterized protein YbjT (DUF2867 family)